MASNMRGPNDACSFLMNEKDVKRPQFKRLCPSADRVLVDLIWNLLSSIASLWVVGA